MSSGDVGIGLLCIYIDLINNDTVKLNNDAHNTSLQRVIFLL